MRTGDTPADERRRLVRNPPDILITTPESLYLMLTSAARETLRGVEAVIIDEIHALAATKRGSHLAVTLERLDHWVGASGSSGDRSAATLGAPAGRQRRQRAPQRIGLSATQRPLEEIARFLGGTERSPAGERRPRPVTVVDAGVRKPLEIEVVIPVDDMAELGTRHRRADVRSRGGRTGAALDLAGHAPAAARAGEGEPLHADLRERPPAGRAPRHPAQRAALGGREPLRRGRGHPAGAGGAGEGAPRLAVAERRLQIEDELKSGRLKGLVATSSLELGIDMGAVDLVIQVESPGAVATGLQRVGSGRPPGRRAEPREALPQAPGRPPRGRRRRRAHAGRPDRGRRTTRATRSTCCASRSSRCARSTSGGSTTSPTSCGRRRPSPSCPTRCWPPCSTCCPVATRPRSSPSCGPASCGTASRAPCAAAPAPSASPSPTPAPSPTAASSPSRSPTAPASASSTRRWSTSRGPGRRSCSARPPGGSRTSPSRR